MSLAQNPIATEQRPAAICILAGALAAEGYRDPAIELLVISKQIHTDSFWLRGVIVPHATSQSPWLPADSETPLDVLFQTRTDTREKKFSTALRKFEWLKSNVPQDLEFVMWQFWCELGRAYPDAKRNLESHRQAFQNDVHRERNVASSFRNWAAINEVSDREAETSSLFAELHDKNPSSAVRVFPFARKSLAANNPELLELYAAMDREHRSVVGLDSSQDRKHERRFQNMLTLIKLLRHDGRVDEAKAYANDARQIWKDKSQTDAILKALGR